MSGPILISSSMRREGQTGLQTHARMFLASLTERRRTCAMVTPYNAPLWQVYPIFGLRKLIDPLNGSASVWWHMRWHEHFLRQALRRRLRQADACVIYAQCLTSAQAALKSRRSHAQRVVMAVHFNISQADEWLEKGVIPAGGLMYRAIRKLEADVLSQVDGLVFVSEFMRRELMQRFPAVTRLPYAVVPNFVSDPGVAPAGAIQADLINIGTLEPRKNQGYLLDIIAAARRQGSELRLTIVGEGPDRAALEARARKLEIDHLVRFTGFVNNAAQLLGRHRAYVHVARLENLPLTLIEALSRGLPVFAPAVGGIPEVFDDGIEGRLLPLDDANRATRMMIEWLQSPQQLAQAGAAARRRFLTRFQSSEAATRLMEFLELAGKQ